MASSGSGSGEWRETSNPQPLATALGRPLARTARVARIPVDRKTCDPRAARQVIVLCSEMRLTLMRVMDPDPMSPGSSEEVGTPFPDPLRLLTWLRGFVE